MGDDRQTTGAAEAQQNGDSVAITSRSDTKPQEGAPKADRQHATVSEGTDHDEGVTVQAASMTPTVEHRASEIAKSPPLQAGDESGRNGGGGREKKVEYIDATPAEGESRPPRKLDESTSCPRDTCDLRDPGHASSTATASNEASASASTAPLHLLAEAAAAPLHSSTSEGCGAGGHCRSCTSLLRQCSKSNLSLESRLEQILQCNPGRSSQRGADKTSAGNHSQHTHAASLTAAGRLPHSGAAEPHSDIASCVNTRHAKRFSVIREALSRKTADQNRRHRDELKRVLRAIEDDRRRRISEETGIPLERVRLASKPSPSSAKTSPDVHHDKDPPRSGFEGDGAVRDSCLNATACAEEAPLRIAQRWLDETQKAMGRYLAQKALVEQSSKGSESSRITGVPEPVVPFALSEEESVVAQATSTENGPKTRVADPSCAPERPAAVLPIKKRKEATHTKDNGMKKKKARKASPARSPKPLTELERLERETRECHKKTLPAGNDGTKLRSFALEYNEWSVLAVAKWANQSSAGGGSRAPLELPTSPTHFRKCNVCGTFGHFDVLCPRLSPGTRKAFRAEMDHLVAKTDQVTDMTELCEGYAIEQSNQPFDDADAARGSRKRRLPSQVCVTELDHLLIQAAPTADLLLEFP
jgi:hypothetical protein